MLQAVQIGGAFMILAAFGLVQARRLSVAGVPYFVLNFLGGLALGISAVVETQWGFIILETAWCAISLRGLIAALRQA